MKKNRTYARLILALMLVLALAIPFSCMTFAEDGNAAEDAAQAVLYAAEDAAQSVGEAVGDAAEAVGDAVAAAADKVGEVASDAAEAVGEAAETIGAAVEEAAAAEASGDTVFTLGEGEDAVEYDLSDPDSAQEYVDGYADNIEGDPGFESHIQTAIAKVRESVKNYATIWSLLPPIIAIVLALITKEVYS